MNIKMEHTGLQWTPGEKRLTIVYGDDDDHDDDEIMMTNSLIIYSPINFHSKSNNVFAIKGSKTTYEK